MTKFYIMLKQQDYIPFPQKTKKKQKKARRLQNIFFKVLYSLADIYLQG